MTESQFNLTSASLPVIAVIGVMGFTVWVTTEFLGEKRAMDDRTADIGRSVVKLNETIGELGKSVGALNETLASTWSRRDMAAWCFQASAVNPGWICPSAIEAQAHIPEQAATPMRPPAKAGAWRPVNVGR